MINRFALLLILLLSFTNVHAEEKHYCHDSASWAEWDRQLEKANDDNVDFKALYALRVGLCTMIERNQILIKDAIRVFEAKRKEYIDKRKKEQKNKQWHMNITYYIPQYLRNHLSSNRTYFT